jgi:hypothetical protein
VTVGVRSGRRPRSLLIGALNSGSREKRSRNLPWSSWAADEPDPVEGGALGPAVDGDGETPVGPLPDTREGRALVGLQREREDPFAEDTRRVALQSG